MVRQPLVLLLISLAMLAQAHGKVGALDTEQRDYSILVDGKEAGQSRIQITVQDDGATVVVVNAQVKINQLVFNYSYHVDSTEWWKDGKLVGLKSSSAENGKHTELVAATADGKLKVRVNGRERLASQDAWPSSFWKLADARHHNKSVPVLDSDSGKEYVGQLQYVGTEQLTLLSQPQSCYRFRVTGGPYPVDVWFDRYHRMVRQEFTDSGHKTIVQLIALKR
jgi:hypothetical protein